MRALLLTLSLLLGGAQGMAQEPSAWILFAPEGGDFRVLLPDEPETRSKSRRTFLGDVVETRYVTPWRGGEVSVEHHDIPGVAIRMLPDGLILEQAGDNRIEHVQGAQRASRTYTWNGHAALDLVYEVPGASPRLERARLILVEARLYLLSASWQTPEEIPAQLRAFFDSFELTSSESGASPD